LHEAVIWLFSPPDRLGTKDGTKTVETLLNLLQNKRVWKILVGKPEGKRPLGRPRRRCEDIIIMDLWEIGLEGVD
jgi:hypothetical protein